MARMKLGDLKPGMRICRNVFDRYGKLLVAEGTILKPQYIRKLELYGVAEVYVDSDNNAAESSEPENSRKDIIYQEAFTAIKDVMAKVKNGKNIEAEVLVDVVESVVNQVTEDSDSFLRINTIRDLDNYTYLHSIDVCIYSVIMGRNIGLSREELNKLGLGAILHDVGKIKVPSEILQKPGPLTSDEFAVMKNHTVYGYEIVSEIPNIDKAVAKIALNHHEHWNGNGYPRGIKGNNIDVFSRIVTICDIYDALTADRVYRGRILPHEAAEYIVTNKEVITDPALTKNFVENVAVYPVGAVVLLSTGEIGKVTEIHKSMPLRPVIDIFSHRDSKLGVERHNLNLMDNLTVFIVDVIN